MAKDLLPKSKPPAASAGSAASWRLHGSRPTGQGIAPRVAAPPISATWADGPVINANEFDTKNRLVVAEKPPDADIQRLSPEPQQNGERTRQPSAGCKKWTNDFVSQSVVRKCGQGKSERGDDRKN
jgi:hypothetical protein